MKRIITLALLLCALSVTSAFAVPPQGGTPLTGTGHWSYNPSQWATTRTIATWIGNVFGANRQSVIYTHYNGCTQVTVIRYVGIFETSRTVTEFCK